MSSSLSEPERWRSLSEKLSAAVIGSALGPAAITSPNARSQKESKQAVQHPEILRKGPGVPRQGPFREKREERECDQTKSAAVLWNSSAFAYPEVYSSLSNLSSPTAPVQQVDKPQGKVAENKNNPLETGDSSGFLVAGGGLEPPTSGL